jgi:hypothetical protein
VGPDSRKATNLAFIPMRTDSFAVADIAEHDIVRSAHDAAWRGRCGEFA